MNVHARKIEFAPCNHTIMDAFFDNVKRFCPVEAANARDICTRTNIAGLRAELQAEVAMIVYSICTHDPFAQALPAAYIAGRAAIAEALANTPATLDHTSPDVRARIARLIAAV